jgi:hypothetical protein
VNAAPMTKHQIVALKLAGRLDAFVEEHSLGQVMTAPVDVLLSMTDIVQPDILFVETGGALTSPLLPGLSIRIADVFP